MGGDEMELKEKIKKEIDSIPEEYLIQLEQYLEVIKGSKQKDRKIKTLHLKGRFDGVNIRRLAYE